MFDWFNKNKKHTKPESKTDIVVQGINQSSITVHTGDTHIHNHPEKPPEKIQSIVDIFHLPQPTTALIGRKTELAQLTEAFTNPNKRLAIIVAAGGIGKSALTDEWLQQIGKEHYYGKTRVFGWSFYSQGSHNTFTNSQPFFSAVLPFLGISEIPKDEIEKARLLAQCLQQQPCLLILDGLEPLQYAQNLSAMNGELQDSALKEFISCFRRTAGNSFVLFSSRQPLVELDNWQLSSYLNIDLERLTEDEGVLLLRQRKISLSDDELKEISHKLRGHALSLVLFGCLLSQHRKIQESWRKVLKLDEKDDDNNEFHTFDVLECYCKELDENEYTFLQLLGLFDRPMNAAEKSVLIAYANHAEPLRALTDSEWKKVEQRLEKSGLLLGKKGSFERLEWDMHPIIRSFFGQKFKEGHPEAFKQAHLVLFDYYQKLPEKIFKERSLDIDNIDTFIFERHSATFEEMQPFYSAVIHGCLAEEYQKSKWIYDHDIRRMNKGYNTTALGAYSETLTVLAAFFPLGWEKSNNNLTEEEQAILLGDISFCLMSLGRLQEAFESKKISTNFYDAFIEKVPLINNWIMTCSNIAGLVDLNLLLGNIVQAKYFAIKAINYIERISSSKTRKTACLIGAISSLATVLHNLGNLNEAGKYFKQDEELEKNNIINLLYLTGYNNYSYCSLLLNRVSDKACLQEIIKRTKYALQVEFCEKIGGFIDIKNPKNLLSIALNNLILARAYFALNDINQAEQYFQQSIQDIQKARTIVFEPIFYLYRADFHLSQNQLDPALADLMSAYEIIERCGMKLYAVDYCLIHGRYSLAIKDHDTALNHYIEAQQLIEETSYHLRDAELDLFAAQLRQHCGEQYRRTNPDLYSKTADDYLQQAKQRIADIGQWGLLRVIERDFPGQSAESFPRSPA